MDSILIDPEVNMIMFHNKSTFMPQRPSIHALAIEKYIIKKNKIIYDRGDLRISLA